MAEERLSKIEKIMLEMSLLATLAGIVSSGSEKYEKQSIPSAGLGGITYIICTESILTRYQKN